MAFDLTREKLPLLCSMIQAAEQDRILYAVRRGHEEGCGAFGYQFCQVDPAYRDAAHVREVFAAMEGKPVYVTDYRGAKNAGKTDEELAEELVFLAKQGASLCDVMGDYYCRTPGELTMDPGAVRRQRELIGRIHEAGAAVLMSSHVLKYTPGEEVLRIAMEQQARGADVVKIVTAADSEEEERENLKTTILLKEELSVPFLFLSGGTHNRLHRTLGIRLGCALALCVPEHDALSTKSQPLLSDMRALRNLLDPKKG